MNRLKLNAVACAAALVAYGAGLADDAPQDISDVSRLCERVRPAFVFIEGGSGVVISSDGLMLTNAHVIGKGKQFDVRLGNGRHFRAKLIGKDVPGDLAVLQLENKSADEIPHLELGDSQQLRLGDRVLAIGNPVGKGFMDLEPTFTLGVVSGLNQPHGAYPDAVVTDAPVNPGNSGGPLVNMQGQVVGIVGQLRTRWGLRSNTGLGYAISARRIRVWLPRLKESGGSEVRRGAIPGMEFERSDEGLFVGRPRIASVVEGSHADKCGLQAGDVIASFEGVPVSTLARLRGLIAVYPEGQEVEVGIERDGRDVTITAKLVRARPGKIGMHLARPGKDDSHVRIEKVDPSSPAEKAGLQAGDEIVAVGPSRLDLPVQAQFRLLEIWLERAIFVDEVVVLTVRRKDDQGKYQQRDVRVVPK
jgi:S1-C subfamily serine protease